MKYHVTYTRILTLEGEIDAPTEQEAKALAEETAVHEGNQDIPFDEAAWKASLRHSARDVGIEMNDTEFDAFAQLALEHW